jgi:TRAP-type C4-dicarboxylate transport system substrate-binding protein
MKQSIFNRIYQLALMRQTVFVSFTALLLFIGSHSQAATFKVATLSPDGSFWMKTMRAAGKEVAVATDDRVKFKWYPGGVMGDDKAVLRKMRVGQLQGAALPMGELLSFYPDSQAYGIPFLFRSYEEVDYVRSQLDASLIEGFAEGGMEVLGIAEGGFGYFLATEPVRVPEDLRQQKVWVPQNDVVSARLAQSIGVTPIPLTLPDVLPGLQTGLINTVAVSPIGAIALQWHTRVDYVTDIPLMYFCGVMTLTGKSFNKLSAQDQTIVREVFGKAFKHIEERNRIDNVSAFDALLNQGVESVVLNDAEKNIWLGMQQPAEQMMQTEGQLSTAALERIKALVRDFRQSQ